MSEKVIQRLGSLNNKNKRNIGQQYPLQRFSVGDELKREDGVEGVVMARAGNSAVVRWTLKAKTTLVESLPFHSATYEFIRAVDPTRSTR